MTAQVDARYKFKDNKTGKDRGDVELDVDYEHWGPKGASYVDPNGMVTGCRGGERL